MANSLHLEYDTPDCELVSLLNYGFTKSFNNIIETLSSCTLLVKKINKLYSENVDLNGFKTLAELLQIVIDNYISESSILESFQVEDWKNFDNLGSYDLLMSIMNSIYDERRLSKGNPIMDIWLKESLPLRIILEYGIYCVCGYSVFSPPQAELSINVSTFGHGSKDLQSLVNNYFAESSIDGRVCDRKNCTSLQGMQIRKLSWPLPETICVHIERQDSSHKARHINELIIKKEYCVNVPHKNIVYYLKSVIVTGGTGGFKKKNEEWYYIGNDSQSQVEEHKVLSCKADVLFYELMFSDELTTNTPGSIVGYSLEPSIYCVIQSLAAINNFTNWLNDFNDSDMIETKTMSGLTAKANNDDVENTDIVPDVVKNWNMIESSDIYEVISDLLDIILNEVRSNGNEKDGDVLEYCPWKFMTSYLRECTCGSKIIFGTKTNMSLDIVVVKKESKNLQELLDGYFIEEDDPNKKCPKQNCSQNKVSKRILVHHRLPRIMCVRIVGDINVDFAEQLQFRGRFSTISEQGNKKSFNYEFTEFILKSVILRNGSDCYRSFDTKWFHVNDKSSETVDVKKVLSCNPSILFYETDTVNEETEDLESNDPIVLKSPDTLALPETCFNRIILLLSSCVKFVDWLNLTSNNKELVELRTLSCLINSVKGSMEDDKEVDSDVFMKWNENGYSDIYEVLKMILFDITNELYQESMNVENHLPIVIYNCSSISSSTQSPVINLDWSDMDHDDAVQIPLQSILDRYFEIWLGYDELHLNVSHKIPISEALPDTICFNFTAQKKVEPSLSIVVKNISCRKARACLSNHENCCRCYRLRSLIDNCGYCYKVKNDGFYKVSDGRLLSVDEDDVSAIEPQIMIFEWQQ